jgi:hypothetical protein
MSRGTVLCIGAQFIYRGAVIYIYRGTVIHIRAQ